jgi:hypothetical protein
VNISAINDLDMRIYIIFGMQNVEKIETNIKKGKEKLKIFLPL